MKLYVFRAISLPIIRSLFTVHSALVHVIQLNVFLTVHHELTIH